MSEEAVHQLEDAQMVVQVLKQRLSNHVSNYEEAIASLNVEVARRDQRIAQLSAQLAEFEADEEPKSNGKKK